MFYNTPFRRLEPKLYSITILRTVLYGEIILRVDKVHYNSFWMAIADTLKVCQALSKTGHSVASSMGYFIEIMLIKTSMI